MGNREYAEKTVCGSFNLNNSEKHRISYAIFLGNTRYLYEKNEPTLGNSVGGGGGGCTVRTGSYYFII